MDQLLRLLSCLLLICNRLTTTLTGTGVVFGLLTPERKTETVTDASVATDVHQTFDIELHFTSEVTLYLVFGRDDLTDGCSLIVGLIFHLGLMRDACLVKNMTSCAATDSIDGGQSDGAVFFLRQVNTYNSYCHTVFIGGVV